MPQSCSKKALETDGDVAKGHGRQLLRRDPRWSNPHTKKDDGNDKTMHRLGQVSPATPKKEAGARGLLTGRVRGGQREKAPLQPPLAAGPHGPSRGSHHVSWRTRHPQGTRQVTSQQDPSVERSGRQTVSTKSQISVPCHGSDSISPYTRPPMWPSCQNALTQRKAADDRVWAHAAQLGRARGRVTAERVRRGEMTLRHRGQNCTRRRTAGPSWTGVRGVRL